MESEKGFRRGLEVLRRGRGEQLGCRLGADSGVVRARVRAGDSLRLASRARG